MNSTDVTTKKSSSKSYIIGEWLTFFEQELSHVSKMSVTVYQAISIYEGIL